MLKIFSTKQIRALDAYTIQHEPVTSIDLMERACQAFVTWFTDRFDASYKVGIVCGTGNNGGDGLGIGRMLHDWSYRTRVWVVKGNAPESADFKINLERLRGKVEVIDIEGHAEAALFEGCDILIDALFGSGLSRPVAGIYAEVINAINTSQACRIAVDIPSGLMADAPSVEPVVRADHTVSFQLPKLAFLLPENQAYVGNWVVVDIKLSKAFIRQEETPHVMLQLKDMKKFRKKRSLFAHKGTYGRAMIVAGSYGKMGAAILAARAAMRSGVGLLTVHTPRLGYTIIQTAVPEAMTEVDQHDEIFSQISDIDRFDAIGIGPGIGQAEDTVNACRKLFEKSSKPLVIDADGLNILAAHPELIHLLPEGSILTPHPKEFERLVGPWTNDFEKLEKLTSLSTRHKLVVLLKGAYSAIASPEGKIYFNPTGNPGMATGGSGDVLTGFLTGLLAQGYTPLTTALYGVFLHGLAGDMAARDKSMEALIASDIVEAFPQAFRRL